MGHGKKRDEEDEDDYENDPWDEDSSKRLKKKEVPGATSSSLFDMKPAKNNIPVNVKDDFEDEFDDAPIVLNNKGKQQQQQPQVQPQLSDHLLGQQKKGAREQDNGLFVDNDFGDDFSEEEEEEEEEDKAQQKKGARDIFDQQRPSQD